MCARPPQLWIGQHDLEPAAGRSTPHTALNPRRALSYLLARPIDQPPLHLCRRAAGFYCHRDPRLAQILAQRGPHPDVLQPRPVGHVEDHVVEHAHLGRMWPCAEIGGEIAAALAHMVIRRDPRHLCKLRSGLCYGAQRRRKHDQQHILLARRAQGAAHLYRMVPVHVLELPHLYPVETDRGQRVEPAKAQVRRSVALCGRRAKRARIGPVPLPHPCAVGGVAPHARVRDLPVGEQRLVYLGGHRRRCPRFVRRKCVAGQSSHVGATRIQLSDEPALLEHVPFSHCSSSFRSACPHPPPPGVSTVNWSPGMTRIVTLPPSAVSTPSRTSRLAPTWPGAPPCRP